MPTNNPKVSAYVPQHIFDRFKAFYGERQLSMSQAIAVILSEYFQLDQQVNHDSKLLGSLLTDRLTTLEDKLISLENYQSESTSELLSEFRNLTTRVSSLEQNLDSSNKINSQSKAHPNQLSLLETDYQSDHAEVTKSSEPDGSLLSNLPSKPTDISSFQPLSGKFLALRLNVQTGSLSANKTKMKEGRFHDWLREKDPDGIQWKFIEKTEDNPSSYVPIADTPSELLDRLLTWLGHNKIV